MMKNNSLKEIGEQLEGADSLVIFPHVLMDGDAMGSAVALCRVLRGMGKEAWILLEDKIPDYLMFLDKGFCTYDKEKVAAPDICLCIDCGDTERFKKRVDVFQKGKSRICVDHHPTSDPFVEYNHINTEASATGEIVYDLILEMGWPIEKEAAEAIFTAITTDTGNFQYSNTTKRSHEITADLYDYSGDFSKISVEIYQNEDLSKFRLESKIIDTAEVFAKGKGIIACVTQKMLEEAGARMEETEGMVAKLRSVKGVQIAVLIKENDTGEMKVAMRAKEEGNVAKIAGKYNGGGHIKAAGCTIYDSMENVRKLMIKEVSRQFGY
ncbi:MAG TPA: bifunctional oligoribonuclease/PAP phosphatase NrnA [Bacillota bacterium]|nr:bifunctional oligoribonuclease/PAP phosphatase NrnA [Bacillota bacterium]